VVGVGTVGEWHVRIIPQIAGCKLVAVCDVDEGKAKAALTKHNLGDVPVYKSQRKMLRKHPEIEVVHVCTPSGDHMGPAIMAMKAGKNVICEKPLEVTVKKIDKMIVAAQKHGVRLAGIFQNRWNPAYRAIKAAADEGRFGTLAWGGSFTPWFRTDQYYADGGWRGTWKLDGGGAMMNQSVHAVDLLQWICGPVKTVSAMASSRIHPKIEVEDTLSCTLQFENGAYGTIVGSTAMFPGSSVRIHIGGENGTAIAEGDLKMFTFCEEREADKKLLEGETKAVGGATSPQLALDLHGQNVRGILEAWEQGRDADTNGPEARKAVAIILAMYKSAKKGGRPVPVE
jgi:predicted dehydrogenase